MPKESAPGRETTPKVVLKRTHLKRRGQHTGSTSTTMKKAINQKVKMKNQSEKPAERKCPKCNGTGFPAVAQPSRPDRKIYPVRCENCGGKGRITDAAT
jgi:DnaJ-class molecular chaperone